MAFLTKIPVGTVLTGPESVYAFSSSEVSVVQVAVNVAAVSGTSPSLQLTLEVLGADGVWYSVWKPAAITAAGQTVTNIGPGCANAAVFAANARLRLDITGTTPSFTLSASVNGH